jgi:Tol biopolymer transport system component
MEFVAALRLLDKKPKSGGHMNAATRSGLAPLCALLAALTLAPAHAQIQRISTALDGTQANHDSYEASLSDDGSVIAFRSSASNLLAGDVNDLPDVFLRDLDADTIERVNVDSSGNVLNFTELYRGSYAPSLSDDGQRVVFTGYRDFAQGLLRDRLANTTIEVLQISFTADNTDRQARQESRISGNGQFVVFHSRAGFQSSEPPSARPVDVGTRDMHSVFLYDAITDPVPMAERLSRPDFSSDIGCIADNGLECPEGNADSFAASVSDDGRRVAFDSHAGNLVPEDDNDYQDVFVKFRFDAGSNYVGIAGPITRVSVSSLGVQANDDSVEAMISGNGRFVAFRSLASNLISGDDNGRWDIYVHDLDTAQTSRVSVASDGTQSNHDSFSPALSDDGRYVVFRSNASNLVADDTNARQDIYVHDRNSGLTARASLADGGGQSDGHSNAPQISGDGQWIVFESDATNLVPADSNQSRDIFRIANPLFAGGP